ncbi:MAG: nitrilase-related carbon-nitrogen hydrolase [Sedimentisphaerales bacterium]
MNDKKTRLVWWKKQMGPLAGFLSGTLLMVPGIFPVLAPIQVLAFVPLLVALRRMRRWRECFHAGFLMGLGFVAPQILWLQLPSEISLILVTYFIVSLIILVAVSWALVRPTGIMGCFAFGAFMAIFDWIVITAMPMWGTAQSFARCWSWYPSVIAFTCATGTPGLMFVLGATQALAVNAFLSRGRRLVSILALAIVLGIVAVVDVTALSYKPVGHLKVATIGWALSQEEGGIGTSGGFDRLYAEPVAAAVRQGARLIVSPETAFAEYDDPSRAPFSEFVELSRRHRVYLAVGYLDTKSQENRVVFIGPSGDILGRYTKTHLTPFENNPTGIGRPIFITIDGISVGAMICHDDNYTDISRRYGAKSTGIVVVPTNDWAPVRRAHFQNSIHRAIESRFAVVRAASNGISAIISPTGKRLVVSDHFKEGPALLVTDVPVYDVRTIFSRFGYWFVVASGFLVVVYVTSYRAYNPAKIYWRMTHEKKMRMARR